MTSNQITVALEKYGKHIPALYVDTIKGYMQAADDGCMDGLMCLRIKNKWVAFLFSFFLGGIGAGRFYLGDKKIGVIRIVVTVAVSLTSFIPILGIIVSLASVVWIIAEWFIGFKKAKTINYEILSSYLIKNRKGR